MDTIERQCERDLVKAYLNVPPGTDAILSLACGGSRNGKCKIGPQVECVWHLIAQRLMARGRLADGQRIRRPKDWSADRRPHWMERPVPISSLP